MLFAYDTRIALESATALVNTAGDPDELTTEAELDRFLTTWQWTGERRGDARELAQVRALRHRLRPLWTAAPQQQVEVVNDLLRRARALPQLVRHGHWSWHLHATPDDAPLPRRMAVEAAMAMVDVIRSEETDRLRLCAATGCDGVVTDLSKNRSRKYCGTACGNRMATAAYRSRRDVTA